jgi:hypothetical protein
MVFMVLYFVLLEISYGEVKKYKSLETPISIKEKIKKCGKHEWPQLRMPDMKHSKRFKGRQQTLRKELQSTWVTPVFYKIYRIFPRA